MCLPGHLIPEKYWFSNNFLGKFRFSLVFFMRHFISHLLSWEILIVKCFSWEISLFIPEKYWLSNVFLEKYQCLWLSNMQMFFLTFDFHLFFWCFISHVFSWEIFIFKCFSWEIVVYSWEILIVNSFSLFFHEILYFSLASSWETSIFNCFFVRIFIFHLVFGEITSKSCFTWQVLVRQENLRFLVDFSYKVLISIIFHEKYHQIATFSCSFFQ